MSPDEGNMGDMPVGAPRSLRRRGAGVAMGPRGVDGRSVELRISAGYVQWRQVGASSWSNLISVSDITGPRGADGKSVELQASPTHIEWRQAGGSWTNLVALESLKGATGPAGSANNVHFASSVTLGALIAVGNFNRDLTVNGVLATDKLNIMFATALPDGFIFVNAFPLANNSVRLQFRALSILTFNTPIALTVTALR